MKKAIVLLSGGQDSTTALAWACQQWGAVNVHALSVFYGQRHRIELNSARRIAELAGVTYETMQIEDFGKALSPASALVGDGDVAGESSFNKNLPASFVPARNALFLTLASSVMARHNAADIVTGVCQTDFSGYPDCRRTFIDAMERALALALDMPRVSIHTPLMYMTKAETIYMMSRMGLLSWLRHSHTCYRGLKPPCGTCPACLLRSKGFLEAGITDPLLPGDYEMPF